MSDTHTVPQAENISPTDVLSSYISSTHTRRDCSIASPSAYFPNMSFVQAGRQSQYRPAYELTEGKLERAGRVVGVPAHS